MFVELVAGARSTNNVILTTYGANSGNHVLRIKFPPELIRELGWKPKRDRLIVAYGKDSDEGKLLIKKSDIPDVGFSLVCAVRDWQKKQRISNPCHVAATITPTLKEMIFPEGVKSKPVIHEVNGIGVVIKYNSTPTIPTPKSKSATAPKTTRKKKTVKRKVRRKRRI